MPVTVPVNTDTGHLTLIAAGPAHHITAADAEELIRVQVTVARTACEQMTRPAFRLLQASVDRACCLPVRPGWERKAAAQAEIFRQLVGLAGGPAATAAHTGQARLIRDLMHTVGPVANGMITSSRRRLLAHLHAGDADAAALETETHLRTLFFMWRVTGRPAPWSRPHGWPPPVSACADGKSQDHVKPAHQSGGEAWYGEEPGEQAHH